MQNPIVPLLVLIATLCGGCASQVEIPRKSAAAVTRIEVVDQRSPEKKERKRDALFAPLVLLQDDQFSPSALSMFVSDLSEETTGTGTAKLEVDEFRIGDYFPVRLGAGGQGVLGALIFETLIDKNTDWRFVQDMKVNPKSDSVVCIFVGKLNGRQIRVSSSEPYSASPFAGLIYNDADFKRALQVAVKRTALLAANAGRQP